MASLHFEVDTSPMAHSVDSVRNHVNGTTAAVAAMEAAVIATERKAAQTICANVDNGFYMMIKSQISQKAVAAYTEMGAKQMSLAQLVQSIENVKRQMENDYQMICRRYAKLFASLNKELEIRVRELDRPAIKLAEIRKQIIFDKLKDDGSMLLECSGEVMQVEQTARAGKLKQKTRDTLRTLGESVAEKQSYAEWIESILRSEGAAEKSGGEAEFYYLPAVLSVALSLLNPNETRENVHIAQKDSWLNTAPIASEVGLHSDGLEWQSIPEKDRAAVRKEFMVICETDDADQRVRNEIIRMFDAATWEETKS
ncbi:MAG: hypothetical protein LBG87_06280 [Spirochaetaceae bacterium]|jgi:hypothetical protein|nr:hypothetical protein [Spirochaetaceae bacterium]